MPCNVIHNEKTHNTCNDIIRKIRNISRSKPKTGLFEFVLSIVGYFGIIYLRISGLEAFSFVAYYPLKCIVYYGTMHHYTHNMHYMVYVLCIYVFMHAIMWFWYYAMQLVETSPLNKISVPAFPDSRFLFPDSRFLTQDFILRLMTHDWRTT